MTNPDLFDYQEGHSTPAAFGTPKRKLVRPEDPDTSHEAAEKVNTTNLERQVLSVINTYDHGCISDDVRAWFENTPYSSVTARYKALIEKGFIEDTGERRKGNSGRNMRVLRITPKGVAILKSFLTCAD